MPAHAELSRFLDEPRRDDEGNPLGPKEEVLSSELYDVLGIRVDARDRGRAGRLAGVMQALGWEAARIGRSGSRGYRRG